MPLTQRGVAQSVTLVTAMGEGAEALDWRALAAPLQTVVFYMGIAQLPRIVERLLAAGRAARAPGRDRRARDAAGAARAWPAPWATIAAAGAAGRRSPRRHC